MGLSVDKDKGANTIQFRKDSLQKPILTKQGNHMQKNESGHQSYIRN